MVIGCGKAEPPVVATPEKCHDACCAGWWCSEHNLPEQVCTDCNPKLVTLFKSKGDWCQIHDRPDSQCFVCHPERRADFDALYEAKYGKKPPAAK